MGSDKLLKATNPLNNDVAFLLFISSTYKIEMTLGHFESVFHTSTLNIFQSKKDVMSLEWLDLFLDKPNFNIDEQYLFTKEQQKILFNITKVSTNEFEFLFSFINITKCTILKPLHIELEQGTALGKYVVASDKMKKISKLVKKIASVNSTVLLLGETGVGKSFLAKEIHHCSLRANQPFVSLNCGALPSHLIESELFGYVPGAFTGGNKSGKIGLFEAADNGTIFLDEIAELPYDVQSKLLDVLQEGYIRKVGGVQIKQVDVRVIAATNKDLSTYVKKQLFREDLYYRLNVVPLEIPPLRERKEEIPILIEQFLQKYNAKYLQNKSFSTQIKVRLMEYHWPGNIRELENVIERMVVTDSEDVFEFLLKDKELPIFEENSIEIKGIVPLKEARETLEKELLLRAYQLYGSTYKAAKALQVDQSTVVKKLKKYNISNEG